MRPTKEDWKYRIINATPTRLVIVTYDIILERIETAAEALGEGRLDSFRSDVNNAKEYVVEMAASVNTNAPVASELIGLYIFVNKLLTKAYFSKNEKYLRDAYGIIEKLRDGLSKEVDDGFDKDASVEASVNYSPGFESYGGHNKY